MWPEPSPVPAPPTPRLRDSRVVRASFAIALAVALVALVATGALIAAEHFAAQLHHRTNLALAGISAVVVLAEVVDQVTRLLGWGFRRPPAPTLAARTPLTWAAPPPPPSPAPLAPVVPLRRRDKKEQEQERRRVQAALILGPTAAPPAPPPAPRPNRRDREPRPHRRHEVPRRPRRDPRPARQPKGLVVGWAHAEQDGRVAMWVRGPAAGTQCVEGDDLDVVEAEVDARLREAVVRDQHAEIVTGRDLRALARAWAEMKGADR